MTSAVPEAYVMRVLTGPRTGSEAALPASGRATIGHEYWHDIVVRDASTRDCAVEIDIGTGELARLTVLGGEVVVLGAIRRAGDTATLPPYVPLTIGSCALAYGHALSARWAEAIAIAISGQPSPAPAAGDTASSESTHWERLAKFGTRLGEAIRPTAVLGIIAAMIMAVAAGPMIDVLEIGRGPVDRVERALNAAGFHDIIVKNGANDELTLIGYVPTESDRQRVQQLIDGQALRAAMSIETGDELARSTADIARLNGVAAQTHALGPGIVELTAAPLVEIRQKQLSTLIRHDVPGLKRLVFRNAQVGEPTGDMDPVKTVDDATKRVSTVVTGNPSYILTADGARYFVGATMPSGHRLVAIEPQTVVLERNGRRLLLRF